MIVVESKQHEVELIRRNEDFGQKKLADATVMDEITKKLFAKGQISAENSVYNSPASDDDLPNF